MYILVGNLMGTTSTYYIDEGQLVYCSPVIQSSCVGNARIHLVLMYILGSALLLQIVPNRGCPTCISPAVVIVQLPACPAKGFSRRILFVSAVEIFVDFTEYPEADQPHLIGRTHVGFRVETCQNARGVFRVTDCKIRVGKFRTMQATAQFSISLNEMLCAWNSSGFRCGIHMFSAMGTGSPSSPGPDHTAVPFALHGHTSSYIQNMRHSLIQKKNLLNYTMQKVQSNQSAKKKTLGLIYQEQVVLPIATSAQLTVFQMGAKAQLVAMGNKASFSCQEGLLLRISPPPIYYQKWRCCKEQLLFRRTRCHHVVVHLCAVS